MLETLKENRWVVAFFLISFLLLFPGYITSDSLQITTAETAYRLIGCIFFFLSIFLLSLTYKKIIIANLAMICILIAGLELTCFILLGMPIRAVKVFKLPNVSEDHIASKVGSVPYADSIYHSIKLNENDTVYDVRYTIDSFCKRNTPGHDSLKKQYALFFGCSFAFGEGLQDNETFSYYFQELSGTSNAYNFSYSGFGTNHMLARLEFEHLPKQVKEKDGAAFYIFIWDHMYRSIGTMARYTDWLQNAPYYTFENGKLVRRKMFKDGRKFISGCYEQLYMTNIVKYFKIDLPPRLFDYHFETVTEMIKQSEILYEKQFGNKNFYVIFYPSYDVRKKEEYDKLKYFLDKKNIRYIDLTQFINYDMRYSLDGDSHPRASTNKIMATETLSRLKKKTFSLASHLD